MSKYTKALMQNGLAHIQLDLNKCQLIFTAGHALLFSPRRMGEKGEQRRRKDLGGSRRGNNRGKVGDKGCQALS
jgi:hypothetical protein